MTGVVIWSFALVCLALSAMKDKQKTKQALKKAWMSFANLLPQIFAVMLFVGITLALLDPATISKLLGKDSGVFGVAISLIVGSVTLIPPFVAFPLGASLLQSGAGFAQVAAFVSTVMTVGIITLPAEIKYFNKEMALMRNALFFLSAVLFTLIVSVVM